jgi:hypothetical protein
LSCWTNSHRRVIHMLSPKELAATNLDAHHSPNEYLIVVFLKIMHIFFKNNH